MTRPRAVADLTALVGRTIDRRGMLKGGETVVVAVSGGPDSVALLEVLHRLTKRYDLRLHVAHFDHRLREGSDRDAAFVARRAAKLGLPVTIGAADATDKPRGTSPEEIARERRRRFLAGVAEDVGASRIALGHTLDDQAETVLMHVLTGTGRAGLAGMEPVRWWWIRPLIDARREQTHALCRALRIRARIDPTNEDPAFLRNLIRLTVIPDLQAGVNARLPEALARMADVIRDEDRYLDTLVGERAEPEIAEGGQRLSLETFADLPVALQRRAIRILVRAVADPPSHEQTEAIRRLALEGTTGGSVDLAAGLSARREYGFIVVGRSSSSPAPSGSIEIVVPGETDLLPWGVRVRSWIGSEAPASWPDAATMCVLDADRTSFPLRVRRWRPGDRFRPLGMRRQKKVGDFFTDGKVPKARRQGVPLVVDRNDEVVWIVGYRIDDRSKVTVGTRRYLWLSVEEAS